MSAKERTFLYYRPAVINNYFKREHLDTIKEIERDSFIVYSDPKCKPADLKLKSLDYFRNHVARVHGVPLMPSR